MKWPFARHTSALPGYGPASAGPTSPDGNVGAIATVDSARPTGVAPSRRDWAMLPPLKVAGGRAIPLTVHAKAFTESLATHQNLVHSPRLDHVRQIDSPSGSFRGVLAPAVVDQDNAGPALQESSPLPTIEHRHAPALSGNQPETSGTSAIEQLLAIGAPGGHVGVSRSEFSEDTLPGTDETSTEAGPTDGQRGGGRSGLADSRRRGLGPAYHGPLPEAMRVERERDGTPDGGSGVSTEPVPGDVRATMRDVLGIDVGDRLVHRGRAVSAEAESMGAQAFTRDGEIYLHDDVGPLDQPRGRAALAHELTHAAQQIVHGSLHDEATAAGQALEAHAQRVEQFVRGDGGAIKPSPDLLHARTATNLEQDDADVVSSAQQMMREMVDSGLARSDGAGGIVFTMPPSSMTASAGTQRLAGDTPTAHAASQTHWDPFAGLGNTLSQGLANDVLGMAGSAFGFSDEFMGEQRHDLVGQDRQFRRDQTSRAYTELRMEHLRQVELASVNETEAMFDVQRSTTLDAETQNAIDERVTREINERLALLDAQTARALDQLNQRRTAPQPPVLDVSDESFAAALTQLFDDPTTDSLPAVDALLAVLTRAGTTPASGGATRPGGGATTPRPAGGAPGAHSTGSTPGSPSGSPASPSGTPAMTAGGHPTGTTPASPTPHDGTGTPPGTGAGAHATEQHWRTDATMGGRFEALGEALGGDIANAEIGFFGSLLGFDSAFEQGMHDDVSGHHATAAAGAHGAPGVHPGAAHPDAAHVAAASHADAAHGAAAAHPGAAHQTVESIVGDPYALDELATRLYPTIRSRLRQELLIDRERAGLLADFH